MFLDLFYQNEFHINIYFYTFLLHLKKVLWRLLSPHSNPISESKNQPPDQFFNSLDHIHSSRCIGWCINKNVSAYKVHRSLLDLFSTWLDFQWKALNQSGQKIFEEFIHNQPPSGVLRKTCSENMQQIYRRTPMPKCDSQKKAWWLNTKWSLGYGENGSNA